jgi:choline dehydrogenase-like flavoprotein
MLTNQTAALFAQTHNVCVVGAGPIGLVVALELARLGQAVTLLESGVMQVDQAAQSLSDAIVVDARRHTDMSLAIQRRFGGTSNLWGAGCVPLDPIDFEPRPIAGDARWPVPYDEFAAYLPDACRYANCGEGFSQPVADLTVADARFTADRLIRYADPPSFRKAYAASIASSPRIAAFLGVTVTGFAFAENGAVAGLAVQARDGTTGTVKARVFVLACGGVETTRLLLAAQAEASARFGGEDGALGRYYMGHLSGVIADLRLDHGGLDKGLDFFRGAGGAYARRRITADATLQRTHGLSNVAFWPIMPPMRDPAHRDPILSLAYLALSLPPVGRCLVSESLRRINVGDGGDKLAHLGNLVAHIPKVAGFVPRFLYGRYLARRRLPGLHLRNAARRYALQYHAEHLPSRASRIRLANERDATGLRKAVLDLRFAEADADPIVRTHEHLTDWLARTGTGELIWRGPAEERHARILDLAGDGVHQIGAARMAANARQGVVDRDCRVFGCGNLFLAGSVVFPTSGQANPTLTALALGIRQARLIAAEAATHEAAS